MSYYIGLYQGKRELLNCVATPTEQAYGARYQAIIGPFRTKRAALFMLKHGANNPHLQHVNDAERIAKGRP